MYRKVVGVLLAMSMIVSLCIGNVSAAATQENDDWIELPQGYTYAYYAKFDIGWQVEGIGTVTGIVASIATIGLGSVASIMLSVAAGEVGNWVADLMVGEKINGYYYDYVYECDDPGLYPYIYFHHLMYYVYDHTGEKHFVGEKGVYEYALLPR